MSVTLIGGMDRLRRDYEGIAGQYGIDLTVCTGKESCLVDKMGTPDVTVLLTDMLSHNARDVVLQKTKRLGIPVHFLKTSGVSAVRRYFRSLASEN